MKSYVEDLKHLLEDSPLVERKSFVKSFVRKVTTTGTEVLLSYNIPLLADVSSQETLVVPPIVHCGGQSPLPDIDDRYIWRDGVNRTF